MKAPASPTLMSKKALAKRLGVTLRTISRWTSVGVVNLRLRVQYVGSSARFDWADYLAWQRAVDERRGVVEPEGEE